MKSRSELRADTPGCAHCIHLNNAGAALPPRPVLQAMQDYLALEAEIGGYEAADFKASAIDQFYMAVAQMLGARARNIAFAGSATDAYARALSAVPFQPGDVMLTTENDYVSNQIAFLSLQKKRGVRIVRAADAPEGGVDVGDMERLVRTQHPALVAVTHVPTNSGLIQPAETIGRLCRENGIWYLVDACQSAGQMPLNVEQIGCDFLAATFRKFLRGPRGAGFLFVSDRALDAGLEMLLPDMRGAQWTAPDAYVPVADARRFEYWEMAPALILGARAAVEYALETGLEAIRESVGQLAAKTRTMLPALPGVQVLDRGANLSGIVTAWSPAWEAQRLMAHLSDHRINCRISTIGSARIDFGRKNVPWALRISPHYYNTEAEIDTLIEVLSRY
ncbi:MAG: aminotransferase class V-fold PLP-dependent enzyme [Saprospiraceae bacterium]|nr:aminotransferase class V-fold PLP-dependent enzyme [Saprospiraceae bacterium]